MDYRCAAAALVIGQYRADTLLVAERPADPELRQTQASVRLIDMSDLHKRLARTRKRARRQRRKKIIQDFGDMSDEEYAEVSRDHAAAARRRETRQANELRGEERSVRLSEILSAAILELRHDYPKEFFRGGRLQHRKACERIAADLPIEAKRLFKRNRVRWWTIKKYTASLADYSRADETRALAAQSGLLRDL